MSGTRRRTVDRRLSGAVESLEGAGKFGGDGLTIPTPNGHTTYSPHWVIANKAMEQVAKYLASFGMDPSSRRAVAPSTVRQLSLAGMDPDDDDGAGPGGFDDL